MSEIEDFLYGSFGTHGVFEFALSVDRLIVSVAPWTSPSVVKIAEFVDPKITSIDVHADSEEDLNLPWQIIGFESYPQSEPRWKFVLCCIGIEFVFESTWPTLRNP